IVERLRQAQSHGEIVGPHGSGKSTLLAALVPAIEAAGRRVLQFTLHDGQRQLPPELLELPADATPTLVMIDGYEQLSRWSRWRLNRFIRRRGWGLLVTSHATAGLPTLFRTRT